MSPSKSLSQMEPETEVSFTVDWTCKTCGLSLMADFKERTDPPAAKKASTPETIVIIQINGTDTKYKGLNNVWKIRNWIE